MARFPDNWLAELYSKNDIVDVISGYTTLSERSGRYWGLCPFHHEKTPSFSVDRDKQLYYCFGCKQGGNVTNFIMKVENLTFPEAAELLAKRVHMELPRTIDDNEYAQVKEKKKQIIEMNRLAARFYHQTLFSPRGKSALEYLKKRGIDEETVKRFGLGYAPDSWDSIYGLLRENGFSESVIKESGLVSVKDNRAFDAFRDRVMFPILNHMSEVVAFGGRVMANGTPKYLNTKDTLVFNKRRNLYGIDNVRKMKSLKSVVIVEGYMDVVSICAHGVKAAVASLGTALTKEQAQLLKKYTSDVFVAYDGDEAGEIATMKALGILEEQGFKIRVIRFEDNKDPDEFIREAGLAGFAKKVKSAPDSLAYRLQVKEGEFDIETDDGKEQFALAASKILADVGSPIVRERYIKWLAGETGYSEASITEQLQKKDLRKNTNDNNRYNRIENEEDSAESAFLAFLLSNPKYISDVCEDIRPEDMTKASHKNIFSALFDSVKRGIQPTYAELVSELMSDEDRNEAARLSNMSIVEENESEYLRDCLSAVKSERIAETRRQLLESLKSATGDERNELLARISGLDKELKQKRYQD